MQDVGKVVPNLNLRRKPLRQTGDRAALCPWAFSLWGGQSVVLWVKAGNEEDGGHHSPAASGASQGPWAPISVWESPSRRNGIAKGSGRVPDLNPHRANGSQGGLWELHSGYRGWRAGQPLCIALCIVNSPIVKTVNCFPQREGSSLYHCREIQPLPVHRGVQSGPVQMLCPNLPSGLARCPGCGQDAALMTQSLKDSFLLPTPPSKTPEVRLGQDPPGTHQALALPQMLSKRSTDYPGWGSVPLDWYNRTLLRPFESPRPQNQPCPSHT